MQKSSDRVKKKQRSKTSLGESFKSEDSDSLNVIEKSDDSVSENVQSAEMNASGKYSSEPEGSNCCQSVCDKKNVISEPPKKSKRGRPKKCKEIPVLQRENSESGNLESESIKEKSKSEEKEIKKKSGFETSKSFNTRYKTRLSCQEDLLLLKVINISKNEISRKQTIISNLEDENSDTGNSESVRIKEKSRIEEKEIKTKSVLKSSENLDLEYNTRSSFEKDIVNSSVLKKYKRGRPKKHEKISALEEENSDTENLKPLNAKEKSNIEEKERKNEPVLKTSKSLDVGHKTKSPCQTDIVKSMVLKKYKKGKAKKREKISVLEVEDLKSGNLKSLHAKEKSNIQEKEIKEPVLETSKSLDLGYKTRSPCQKDIVKTMVLKKYKRGRPKKHKIADLEVGNSKSGYTESLNVLEKTNIEENEIDGQSVSRSSSLEDLDQTIIYSYESEQGSSQTQTPEDTTALANTRSQSSKEPLNPAQSSEKRRIQLNICKTCNRCYLNKKDVISHYVRVHVKRENINSGNKKERIYKTLSVVFVANVPAKENVIHCSVCDRGFPGPEFKYHSYTCIGPLFMRCTMCTCVFYGEEELNNHVFWDHEDHDVCVL